MSSSWQTVKLQDIADVERGKFSVRPRNDPKYFGGEVPFLQTGDVAGASGIISSYTQTLNQDGLRVSKFFPAGTLLITIAANIGDVAEVGFGFACTDSLVAVQPKKGINKNWLKFFLQTQKKYFESRATQNAQANINLQIIRPLPVPLPSEEEQNAIAAIISTWDIVLEKTERLIEAKILRYAALSNKQLSRRINIVPLKAFLKLTLRVAPKPDKPYWALGIRSHGKGTFRRFVENPSSVAMDTLYKVKHDDLIVNITFAWEGAIAFVGQADEDCFVSHRFPTFEVDINKALPDYLRHVIVQKRFIRSLGLISPGGAGRNRVLNKTDFLKLKISLPELKEQKKIGDVLNTSLQEISILKNKLELLKKQKRGLMQKLLTGQWRVKVDKEVLG